jgi:hypothetical protein
MDRMPDAADPKSSHTLAIIAGALLLVLSLWGLLKHGISIEIIQRMWRDFFERSGEPMSFRFYLQPIMAIIAAVHDGINDARAGRTPYMQKLISRPGHLSETLGEALHATARIVLLALGMDAIYQLTVLGTFYPGEMVMVALLLAVVPYILARGPVALIGRRWLPASKSSPTAGR